jgi:hypothetical protein
VTSFQFTIQVAFTTLVVGAAGAEPHLVCLDGSRLEVYHNGVYRLFEEPSLNGLCVNMTVDNTYIADVSVCDADGVISNVHYDIDSNRQLHANSLTVKEHNDSASNVLEISEDKKNVTITVGEGALKLKMDARYRSFGVEHAEWQPHDVIRIGGALATLVHVVNSLSDNTPGPLIDVEINKWKAHALSCDAHFPHIVSFNGESVIAGSGENHILFDAHNVQVVAKMDNFSRLDRLRVMRAEETVVDAVWHRSDTVPLQDQAPTSQLQLADDPEHVLKTHGMTAAESTRAVDRVIPLDRGCELLVRLQANGGSSFALRGPDAEVVTLMTHAEGLLFKQSSNGHASQPGTASAVTSSIYERAVEPHLAWKRNEMHVELKPTASRIGCC